MCNYTYILEIILYYCISCDPSHCKLYHTLTFNTLFPSCSFDGDVIGDTSPGVEEEAQGVRSQGTRVLEEWMKGARFASSGDEVYVFSTKL